jgi:hypothetical protein
MVRRGRLKKLDREDWRAGLGRGGGGGGAEITSAIRALPGVVLMFMYTHRIIVRIAPSATLAASVRESKKGRWGEITVT